MTAINLAIDESKLHEKNRIATAMLLDRIICYHGKTADDRQAEILEKALPPIPNRALREALVMLAGGIGGGSVEIIQRAVCADFGTTLIDMKSARRDQNIVLPRQVAMYLARHLTLKSLPDISRRFGRRDHSTALHAVKKIAGLIETDPELASQIDRIKASLQEIAA